MEKLKEHRQFRNQLIIFTIIMVTAGLLMSKGLLIGFGIILGILAIVNIYTYRENKSDYNKLNNLKSKNGLD